MTLYYPSISDHYPLLERGKSLLTIRASNHAIWPNRANRTQRERSKNAQRLARRAARDCK